jgi:hypothetical protein
LRCIVSATILASSLVLAASSRPAAAEDVDLELLLAADVSLSVNDNEYALQRQGLADAFRNPDVVSAIEAVPNGVAVAFMQWAGPTEQTVSVQWFKVRDRASCEALAEMIEAVVRPGTNGGTAIGDALGRGVTLLAESSFQGMRQVIDVSGDGRTNIGDSPGPVRFHAALSGITINGLVIINDEPDVGDYYREHVIGGPGAFVVQVRTFDDFARAIRLKLIREIEVAESFSLSRTSDTAQ